MHYFCTTKSRSGGYCHIQGGSGREGGVSQVWSEGWECSIVHARHAYRLADIAHISWFGNPTTTIAHELCAAARRFGRLFGDLQSSGQLHQPRSVHHQHPILLHDPPRRQCRTTGPPTPTCTTRTNNCAIWRHIPSCTVLTGSGCSWNPWHCGMWNCSWITAPLGKTRGSSTWRNGNHPHQCCIKHTRENEPNAKLSHENHYISISDYQTKIQIEQSGMLRTNNKQQTFPNPTNLQTVYQFSHTDTTYYSSITKPQLASNPNQKQQQPTQTQTVYRTVWEPTPKNDCLRKCRILARHVHKKNATTSQSVPRSQSQFRSYYDASPLFKFRRSEWVGVRRSDTQISGDDYGRGRYAGFVFGDGVLTHYWISWRIVAQIVEERMMWRKENSIPHTNTYFDPIKFPTTNYNFVIPNFFLVRGHSTIITCKVVMFSVCDWVCFGLFKCFKNKQKQGLA